MKKFPKKLNFSNFGEKEGGGGIGLVISYTPPSLLFLVACLLLLFVSNNLGIRQDVFTFAILLLSFVFCYRIVVVFFYPSPSFVFFFKLCLKVDCVTQLFKQPPKGSRNCVKCIRYAYNRFFLIEVGRGGGGVYFFYLAQYKIYIDSFFLQYILYYWSISATCQQQFL